MAAAIGWTCGGCRPQHVGRDCVLFHVQAAADAILPACGIIFSFYYDNHQQESVSISAGMWHPTLAARQHAQVCFGEGGVGRGLGGAGGGCTADGESADGCRKNDVSLLSGGRLRALAEKCRFSEAAGAGATGMAAGVARARQSQWRPW